MKRFKNGEFPAEYYCQCVHYMAVTGYKKWYLAVLIFGREFKIFEIDRDEAEISALVEKEREFWNENVLKQVPPQTTGAEGESAAIAAMFAEEDGSEIDLTPNLESLKIYKTLDEQIKAFEQAREMEKQKIQLALGSAVKGRAGDFSVSWKTQERITLDTAAIRKQFPEIANGYSKVSKSRVFRFKEETA